MKHYLQNIVSNLDINNIPADWSDIDFEIFSKDKKLFDYQQKALEHALKSLYLFYQEDNGDKSKFYNRFINNGLTEDLSYNVKKESKTIKYLLEYDKDYPVDNEKISFKHLINRMSFWMATGSGKTLVIVKLIELLAYLINQNKIPKKNILFLTYREDLIEQFKNHLEEFNSVNSDSFISLINLKDYSSRKQNPTLSFGNSIDIFYYRSDLISDEQKDKIVNFKNYENNGNWYIILDEAHKGDREDSKRQIFYSILSRNGFLFNFSATFTDERDFVTCVYNFNLSKFIEEGYGKHIYISKQSVNALEQRNTIIDNEKQKILLKLFILQSAINKQFEEIRKVIGNLYHKPLLLTLVNSVNTEDSDLELFFKEIEKIASNNIDKSIFEEAKNNLLQELESKDAKYEFEDIRIDTSIRNSIKQIQPSDLLRYILNSAKQGKIEVIKLPSNKQELIFKLATSDQPFALMKIGDITEWIKNKLSHYEIIERFENESIFKNINTNEDINILMGSRAFYEGWDSNRPNLILFINIGKGTDAKKFVLQSIGRGVRIEPLPNKRKRLVNLYNNNEVDESLYNIVKNNILGLETLFVFGTKAENLKEVIETLKQEKTEVLLGDLFEINPDVLDKELLIPQYKKSNNLIIEEKEVIQFPINENDFDEVSDYFNYIGDKVALCKYDCNIKVLSKLKEAFNGKKQNYFLISNDESKVGKPEVLLSLIFKHFSNVTEEFSNFKKLKEEIIHFKRIQITQDKLNSLREKIEKVKRAKDKDKIEKELDEKFDKGEVSKEQYKQQIKEIESNIVKEAETQYNTNEKIKIKLLQNHYYIPLALSESETADYIQHVIKHKGEIDFLNELENYLNQNNNLFKQFDWWYFSKIDETLDNVYIPYYNPKTNRIDRFKPDFIFWLKKDNNYTILFVDPKGTEHTDGYRKIDGFSRIFEEKVNGHEQNRNFAYNGFTLTVKLLLKTRSGIGSVLNKYKKYWFDNFVDFSNKIK
ncbi:MAG: DEAD/DEAH box helicase family protein [Candidatus Dojkabacteria bacterium]|nr:DEAD/DEAH box helicase family protein [Candidatus Dojkabacteria bacterium]